MIIHVSKVYKMKVIIIENKMGAAEGFFSSKSISF